LNQILTNMEEINKQLIAIQIIQELIVDVLNEKGVISRDEFEKNLKERVDNLNKAIESYSKSENEILKKKSIPFITNIVGEA